MPSVNPYHSKRSDEQEEVKLYLCWFVYDEKYISMHV